MIMSVVLAEMTVSTEVLPAPEMSHNNVDMSVLQTVFLGSWDAYIQSNSEDATRMQE